VLDNTDTTLECRTGKKNRRLFSSEMPNLLFHVSSFSHHIVVYESSPPGWMAKRSLPECVPGQNTIALTGEDEDENRRGPLFAPKAVMASKDALDLLHLSTRPCPHHEPTWIERIQGEAGTHPKATVISLAGPS
jgi:hypothetical protein